MMSTRVRVLVSVAGALLLFAGVAFANGINPPRPREGVVINVSCVAKSGGQQHEILRARVVVAGKATDRLTIRIDGASEQIDLADIKSLTFTAVAVDADGFVPAKLVRRDDTTEDSTAVQVRVKKSPVRLRGFDASGANVSAKMEDCGTLAFSTDVTGAPAPEHRPATAR